MNVLSVPGRHTCYRYAEQILPNNSEAIHGGGDAIYPVCYDASRVYRDKALAFFETDYLYHTLKAPSRWDCVVALQGVWHGFHDSEREWIHSLIEGRYSATAYRAYVYTCLYDAESIDQGFGSDDGYRLMIPFRYESKTQFLDTVRNFYDSLLIGGLRLYSNRFSVSSANLRAMYRSKHDTLRIWTPDVYRGRYDLNVAYTKLLYNRPAAIIDPSEWPDSVCDNYSCVLANPPSYRVQGRGKYDIVDPFPWTVYRFLYDVFLYFFNDYPAHRQAFVRSGWMIMAKNLETEQIAELGFVDADNVTRSLENISLPDGDYEISVLTSSLFWKDSMDGNVRTISVRPGEEISPLPVIHNLRSAIADGATTVYWSASKSEIEECLFGIWYSSESPVDVNRTPDATVWYSSTMTEYQNSFAQNAPAWVAVAAMRIGDETEIGKVHQLYLDWSNVPPRAPDDVVILDDPLPVFDADVLERPLEDVDLALVF